MPQGVKEAPVRLVLAGLAAIGLLFGVYWLGQQHSPPPVLVSNAMADAPNASGALPPPSSSARSVRTTSFPAEGKIYVDVSGAVKHPDVYTLPPGARVFQALHAAGGFASDASVESVNRAARLEDGDQVLVLTQKQAESSGHRIGKAKSHSARGRSKKKAPDGRINLNTATAEELEELPGIGPELAQRIIAYRELIGRFQDTGDVATVDGMSASECRKI